MIERIKEKIEEIREQRKGDDYFWFVVGFTLATIIAVLETFIKSVLGII